MKIKTSELTGAALDWAVTSIEDPEALRYGVADWREQRRSMPRNGAYPHRYCKNWAQGGPIMGRECMEFDYDEGTQVFSAFNGVHGGTGKTHLIAAMRCYVASKLGDEVEVPDELCH